MGISFYGLRQKSYTIKIILEKNLVKLTIKFSKHSPTQQLVFSFSTEGDWASPDVDRLEATLKNNNLYLNRIILGTVRGFLYDKT